MYTLKPADPKLMPLPGLSSSKSVSSAIVHHLPNRKRAGAKKCHCTEKLEQRHISANNNTIMLIPLG